MISLSPGKMIVIGFFMVLTGMVLPWLIVLRVLESTFFLNFFSFGVSVAGLFMGMVGAALYVRNRK